MTPTPIAERWVLAEFARPDTVVAALAPLRAGNFGEIDTFSPYPLHGVTQALGFRKSPIPIITFLGGATGVATAYLMQWWCNAVDYPINVGGRPLHSLPSWVPIMFELLVLFGSFGAFFGLWAILRLPQPYHPVFNLERFRTAQVDRHWIGVRPFPGSDEQALVRRLRELGASHVDVVEGPAFEEDDEAHL